MNDNIIVVRKSGEMDRFAKANRRMELNGSGVSIHDDQTEKVIAAYSEYSMAYVEEDGVTLVGIRE